MSDPLVSVICLCFNHARYVREALGSILVQTYPNLEVIVVDDASSDRSVEQIKEALRSHPQIKFLQLKKSVGNCSAFNRGLAQSTGEFIIDLAADDILLPERIATQVRFFQRLDPTYGVIFSDAIYIGDDGNELGGHFHGPNQRVNLSVVPTGDIYKEVLGMYFIPTPTMMISRRVLEDLDGYDEELAYEDFDFWVRSSRKYKYQYQDKILTKIRKTHGSMSQIQNLQAEQFRSTYRVCQKARFLNQTDEEDEALIQRLKYEFRHGLICGHWKESKLFYSLISEVTSLGFLWKFLYLVGPLVAAMKMNRLLRR